MSVLALSFNWDALRVPTRAASFDATTFVSYILPALLIYLFVAVLAVTPRTHTFRAALWPVVTFLALRAAVSVDMSLGNPQRKYLNIDFVLIMIFVAVRTLHWTLAKEPLVRHLRPANSSPSTIMDALDLALNLRYYGWNWSRGLYVPPQTRPSNRIAFAFYALLSVAAHAFLCGVLQRAILSFRPVGPDTISGGPIFDEALPIHARYLRASVISIFSAFGIYASLQMTYDMFAIPAVLVFRQDVAQWPPAFDAPWRATSLSDFWGRRWHQWPRPIFLFLGGYPLSFVLGSVGIVFGAFLTSAVFHHIALITLDSRSEPWRMLLSFGMMAPGVLAERVFHRLTGRKVGGVVGWVWTMTWLIMWGNVMVDGFGRAGMFGTASIIDDAAVVREWVEHLVTDFEAWLHAL